MELHIITHIIGACPICGGKLTVRRTKTDLVLGIRTRWAYCKKPCKGSRKSHETLDDKGDVKNSVLRLET